MPAKVPAASVEAEFGGESPDRTENVSPPTPEPKDAAEGKFSRMLKLGKRRKKSRRYKVMHVHVPTSSAALDVDGSLEFSASPPSTLGTLTLTEDSDSKTTLPPAPQLNVEVEVEIDHNDDSKAEEKADSDTATASGPRHRFPGDSDSDAAVAEPAEQLLNVRYIGNLFCDDITYEYVVSCIAMNTSHEWTVRLTVSQLTEFFAATRSLWGNARDAVIPEQYGKVMHPSIFTMLLQRVGRESGILRHEDPAVSQRAANLLSIPFELRPIVQYNGSLYSGPDAEEEQKGSDQFDGFKYLSHRTMAYRRPLSYGGVGASYDDCCALYDTVRAASFWLRSLPKRIDVHFDLLSNNVFTAMLSDASFLITAAILEATSLSENTAWIIADFLPKELRSEHADRRCDAQIVYKYDPRRFAPDAEAAPPAEDEERFVVNEPENAMLLRRGLSVGEVHSLCVALRKQCNTLTVGAALSSSPSMSRRSSTDDLSSRGSSSSLSEIFEFSRSSASDDLFFGGAVGGIPTTAPPAWGQGVHGSPPLGAYSPAMGDHSVMMSSSGTSMDALSLMASSMGTSMTSVTDSGDSESSPDPMESTPSLRERADKALEEKFRLFFTAFVDEEEADDVTLCQWIEALSKLELAVSETELVAAFQFMAKQNADSEGFVDFVDFAKFCNAEIRGHEAQRVQHVLREFIIR